jgi:hypothetical protein
MAVVRGETEPSHRLRIGPWHTAAVMIHEPESVLGTDIALIGQWTQMPQGGRVIAALIFA